MFSSLELFARTILRDSYSFLVIIAGYKIDFRSPSFKTPGTLASLVGVNSSMLYNSAN